MEHKALYKKHLTTPDGIAEMINPGWVCCTDIAAAIPPMIVNALGNRAKNGNLQDVTFHTMLDMQPLSALDADANSITPISWFAGKGLRTAISEGRAEFMPCCYSDIPSLYEQFIDIDAFFGIVSPMDDEGYFSTGITGSFSDTLIQKAKHVFLEVNPRMPRVNGAPKIHISNVDALCESNAPLPLIPPSVLDSTSEKIGALIAERVPDGATLQLGLGAIPDAVGLALLDKHDLGIHTELFTDSMLQLIKKGVITNERKPINKGISVATIAGWTESIYKFVDNNPSFMIRPVNYVNNPTTIAKHPNFIAVNAALEVDFYGQVCAESMGTRLFSGSGGQPDYARGAIMSKGGKSFIAFLSTAKNVNISRIRPTLTPGAIVTTNKNDVDYIVTEYGCVQLRGKTLPNRVKALISIAHPKFRDKLTFEAKKLNFLI